MKLSIISLCLLGLALTASAKVRYDNYKVYRFVPNNEEQREVLLKLEAENPGVLFWKGVRHVGQPVDIMFPPHLQADLLEALTHQGMISTEFIENVQSLLDEEEKGLKRAELSPRLSWTEYHSTEQVHQFLDEQAAANPGVVTVESAGRSYEGRELKVLKIQRGPTPKPAIWLDANIHAREWITNAVATYMINELLTSTDPEIEDLTKDFDWYIMPIMNPDGYEYTRSNDRMWRKTRAPNSNSLCRGADPNRNWGFHWMEGGASNNPCSDTYGGSAAFSEVETDLTSKYIDEISGDIVLYLSLHSYSQLILLPFGHSNDRYPDYTEYMRIGGLVGNAIATRFNTRFTHGNIVDMLYVASGGSMDWVKGNFDTDLTYTLEMRDTGRYGFVLPANQIIPSGQEFMDGLKVLAEQSRIRLAAKATGPSIRPMVRPGNKLPAVQAPISSVGGPSIEIINAPSIRPIVRPGNKLPAVQAPVSSVGGPSIEVIHAPSILPIVRPGNKLPAVQAPVSSIGGPSIEVIHTPSILPIVRPGNKLPAVQAPVSSVGGPSIEIINAPSIRPIARPGNKLPVIRPMIEAVGAPSLETISAPSIRPIVRPGNKLPAVQAPVSAVGSPVLSTVSRPSLLPIVRPGSKLPVGVGKPIIF